MGRWVLIFIGTMQLLLKNGLGGVIGSVRSNETH